MLKSPNTRSGEERHGNKSCGARVRYGGDRWWVLYAFVMQNLGKEKSKNPEGAKISSENKSEEGEGPGRLEVEARREGWTKKTTRGRLWEGGSIAKTKTRDVCRSLPGGPVRQRS